jgi:hypothetical protein
VARKRAAYELAIESLKATPVSEKDAYLATFVKAEKLNLDNKPDPTPRVIQPRNRRYNVEVGLYIKACEHMIYKAIDGMWGMRTVMKGLNADRRGGAISRIWNSFNDPVGIGVDAHRFDQHVSKALLELEHSVYNAIYRSKELERLLSWQLVNKGFANCQNGTVKYTVEGCRMSGDMNTSLGNVLTMCLMMHSYCATKNFRIQLINDGDDCVLVCERGNVADLGDLSDWFSQLGFIMTVEQPVYEIEHVEFCQSKPVKIGDSYRMVRDPRVSIDKDLCVVKPVQHEKDWKFYRRAIGQCGQCLAGDMPIYCEFYRMLVRGTSKSDCVKTNSNSRRRGLRTVELETGMQYLALDMHHKWSKPSPETRASFANAFGINPDMQEALEVLYERQNPKWRNLICVPRFGNLIAGL